MMKVKISILVTLLYTGALYAGGGDFSINPEVQINENGKITMSRYLGEIVVGDDVLPIVMNFRSDMEPSSSEMVPRHEIPLLEAKAVTINERCSKVLLPDGKTIYLNRESAKRPYIASSPWSVEIDGSRLKLKDGDTVLIYNKGRIASWNTASNRGLKWCYDASGLKSLNGGNGTEILSVRGAPRNLHLEYRNLSSSVNWELVQVGERWIPAIKNYSALDGDVFNVDSSIIDSTLIESVTSVNGKPQISYSYNYKDEIPLSLMATK